MKSHPNRRDLLKTGALAALPFWAAARPGGATPGNPGPAPTVGIATFGFPELSNQELARELATAGINTVQLFLAQTDSRYWVYNGRSDLSDLSPQRCQDIAEIYRAEGIAIHSLGVYTNLLHPDEDERKANLDYFEAMFRVGAAMGVHCFITESGHYEPPPEERTGLYHFRDEVWTRMVDAGKDLARRAEAHDAVVLFEPYYLGFLASARRSRLFLEAVGSPRIRALLDAANLLEVNDLEEMFGQLAPYVDCLHAKDRKLHVQRGVAAGQGDLDYRNYVALAAKHAPHAPFILEYVGLADYKEALAVLHAAIQAQQDKG